MSKDYADARFGVAKYFHFVNTASLAGTTAATELQRSTVMEASRILDWQLKVVTGGTSANRSVTLGYSVAGTGAVVNIGTAALGTMADLTVLDAACTETSIAAGDDLVISVIGTAAGAYVVQPIVLLREDFVNA